LEKIITVNSNFSFAFRRKKTIKLGAVLNLETEHKTHHRLWWYPGESTRG